ncbi:hypothetical protein K0B03_02235 [Patescibacteria group bacterium]|nr:hypothetical protein [Patescibacteria group bacterium]
MTSYLTIEDIIRMAKEAGINSNEFFIATKLLIKGKTIRVEGIINMSTGNLLVNNGRTRFDGQSHRSFGPGTRIASIL